jgi:glucosyl-3-phosphoglycerate synthase
MAAVLDATTPISSYRHEEFSLEWLLAAKRARYQSVTVLIPARDEERTIGAIVGSVRASLMEACPFVDEIVVVDDGSSDATAVRASGEGAIVLRGPGLGKGEAMRLGRGRGDLVVFLDGDVENFAPHFVTGLVGPLLADPATVLVKGRYERSLGDQPTGGGRVTELVAKPVISLLFPELSSLDQPLAGETAVRGRVLEELELSGGYGVEIALLIDAAHRYGTRALAQVDLGSRRHRNRPLGELGQQAREVLAAALARAGVAFP